MPIPYFIGYYKNYYYILSYYSNTYKYRIITWKNTMIIICQKKEVFKIFDRDNKGFWRLYISSDGKNKKNKNGTVKYFIKLLCESASHKENIADYPIEDGYRIIYNKNSEECSNRFLLQFVQDTNIKGPIIFINTTKKNIYIEEIKFLLLKE